MKKTVSEKIIDEIRQAPYLFYTKEEEEEGTFDIETDNYNICGEYTSQREVTPSDPSVGFRGYVSYEELKTYITIVYDTPNEEYIELSREELETIEQVLNEKMEVCNS